MKRREFITLVGGAAATWSLPAPAQQSSKLPTIGFLGTDPALWNPWVAAFVKRLSELGWNDTVIPVVNGNDSHQTTASQSGFRKANDQLTGRRCLEVVALELYISAIDTWPNNWAASLLRC